MEPRDWVRRTRRDALAEAEGEIRIERVDARKAGDIARALGPEASCQYGSGREGAKEQRGNTYGMAALYPANSRCRRDEAVPVGVCR